MIFDLTYPDGGLKSRDLYIKWRGALPESSLNQSQTLKKIKPKLSDYRLDLSWRWLEIQKLKGGVKKKKGGGQEADLTFDLSLDLSLV